MTPNTTPMTIPAMAPPLSFLLFPDVDLLFMELFVVEEVDGEDVSTTDVVVTIIVFGC